ncbi:MAG: tetratricopeptide repeat protein [Elusimicrobiales bacterium]|nr:tetratricopeptide repeat protein [Elusimicrobiales bacterium]
MKIFMLLVFYAFSSPYSDFVDALYYEKMENYATSYFIIEKINLKEKDPFLYKYLYNLALKGYKTNQIDLDKLSKNIEKVIELEPNNADNWILYAAVKNQEGNLEQAKMAYKKAIEIDPKNIEAYYQLALLNVNDTQEALNYFNKILEIDPSLASDVYYNIAVLYSLKKNNKKVIEYINKSIKADPNSIKPYYFMALYWEEERDIDKAIDEYKKILSIEPYNSEVLLRLSEIYVSRGNIEEAERYLKSLINYNPKNEKALFLLAILEENKKNYREASKYLSQIDNWEEYVEYVIRMSYYEIMMGNTEKAVNILEKAYQKWPDNYEVAYYLGLGKMDMKDYLQAKKYFEVVVSTKDDFYEVRYNLGVICEKINDVECFKRHFGYLISKNPYDANVLNYLGYSLIDRDIVDEKVEIDSITLPSPFEMIEMALLKEPTNYAYLDSLAWAYYKKGNYQKAYEYIEKAEYFMNLSGETDALIFEHKADIFVGLGKYNEAFDLYIKSFLFDNYNRKKIINDSIKKIIGKVDLSLVIDKFIQNLPQYYVLYGNLKVSFKYKKFLFHKRFNYTFPFIFVNKPDVSKFKLLGPLMLSILEVNFKEKIDFSSYQNLNKYEKKLKDSLNLLKLFLDFRNIFFEKKFNKDINNSNFIFKGVFEEQDILELKNERNFIFFDVFVYTNGKDKYKLLVDEFTLTSDKKFIYPKKIIIGDGINMVEVYVDNMEIKE